MIVRLGRYDNRPQLSQTSIHLTRSGGSAPHYQPHLTSAQRDFNFHPAGLQTQTKLLAGKDKKPKSKNTSLERRGLSLPTEDNYRAQVPKLEIGRLYAAKGQLGSVPNLDYYKTAIARFGSHGNIASPNDCIGPQPDNGSNQSPRPSQLIRLDKPRHSFKKLYPPYPTLSNPYPPTQPQYSTPNKPQPNHPTHHPPHHNPHSNTPNFNAKPLRNSAAFESEIRDLMIKSDERAREYLLKHKEEIQREINLNLKVESHVQQTKEEAKKKMHVRKPQQGKHY